MASCKSRREDKDVNNCYTWAEFAKLELNSIPWKKLKTDQLNDADALIK